MEKKPERQPRSPVEVRTRGKRGPEPERVKIERSWEQRWRRRWKRRLRRKPKV